MISLLFLTLIFRYNNGSVVVPGNLWDAFDKQASHDSTRLPSLPSEIMKRWATNRGYPLITVTKAENRSTIIVEQVGSLIR